jgi:HAD superfamily hydrolase (TIGR01509 family)
VAIRAVVFDVGETLVDETRAWSDWADWLGIPRLTLFAVLGAVIAHGQDHRESFRILRPGIDLEAAAAARAAARRPPEVTITDFYPDAVPTIRALRRAGYRVGIAGNQPIATEEALRELDVELDLVGSSSSWGVEKPDPAFFARIAEELGLAPPEIAYVGDRLDNDVAPAAAAGMRAIFLRRGPWAAIQAKDRLVVARSGAATSIDSLADLADVLAG